MVRQEQARSRWRTPAPRPWIIAHRGDSFHAPENTLEAARKAWQAGAEAWELDVRLTRDRVPVVVHDPSLLRTTNVAERFANDPRAASGFRVADFDLAEIQTLDAGRWFIDLPARPRSAAAFGTLDRLDPTDRAIYASGRVRIPTLAEALALTQELDWCVNIELKSARVDAEPFLDTVLTLLAETCLADRVSISSFDHTDLVWIVRNQPSLAVGVLTATPLWQPGAYVRDGIGAEAYHVSAFALGAESDRYRQRPSAAMLRTEELAELRRSSVRVLVYTVNDTRPGGLADHLAEVGAWGLFTDDPAGLGAHWGRSPRRFRHQVRR